MPSRQQTTPLYFIIITPFLCMHAYAYLPHSRITEIGSIVCSRGRNNRMREARQNHIPPACSRGVGMCPSQMGSPVLSPGGLVAQSVQSLSLSLSKKRKHPRTRLPDCDASPVHEPVPCPPTLKPCTVMCQTSKVKLLSTAEHRPSKLE